MRKQIYCLLSLLWISCLSVSAADRWVINPAGGITWQIDERVPHEDHIEMSGLKVSTVLRYGVDANGSFMLNRSMVWPMLRTIPNNTHASLMRRFAWDVTDMVEVNGQSLLNEKVKEVTLNGTMVVQSEYVLPRKGKLGLTRVLFPSVSNPAFCEKYILRNTGESYYAAIWANDQAEYINPFFPYLGYEVGNRSALCSYEHFARFMNPEYKPIPSSIIAEGIDIWAGAGDRGDAAMVAYGASRYALSKGDKAEAEKLWPLIEWCLEYCRRNLNESGVVASDADELENRFPAGKANLCTSSLYYDALISAGYLGRDLGKPVAAYARQAIALKKNIDRYFGGTVEGFDTYKYYEGNDVLRSWICIPLTVGIQDRKDATIQALFSPRLWTENGLLTQAGSETFWDRSTLYALRGVYACGETEKATDYLKFYSSQRLLGEHVPYAIEAWPEGNQRHLSAESGLYCRIITEGMFGIRPTGLNSFVFTPRLPQEWDHMNLRKICAFGQVFDIEVKRLGDKLQVAVIADGKTICNRKIKEGENIRIKF